jgi:DNA-binding transcriptional regulator YiaG
MAKKEEKKTTQQNLGQGDAQAQNNAAVPHQEICRAARKAMGMTQQEMANLLGVSKKAVQSYEQGWRNTPANVERLCLMYLVGLHTCRRRDIIPCWDQLDCAQKNRERCIVWRLQRGDSCWMFTGTYCTGEPEEKWARKLEICRKCEVLNRIFMQGK